MWKPRNNNQGKLVSHMLLQLNISYVNQTPVVQKG